MKVKSGQPAPANTNMKNTDTPHTATEAQIDANRRNAQKSSGPHTAEGKTASSRNALKHGLSANKHILLDEDPEEFLLLLKDLYGRFRPVGLGEEKLVERIAADQWRLDRAIPMEAGIYRQRLEAVAAMDHTRKRELVNHKRNHELRPESVPPPPAPPDEGDRLARAFTVDCERPNSLAKLARYEGSIQRSIDRSLRQLKAFQAARNTPAPGPPETGPQPGPEAPSANQKTEDCETNPKNGGSPTPSNEGGPPLNGGIDAAPTPLGPDLPATPSRTTTSQPGYPLGPTTHGAKRAI
jgi:hypothetical protein